MLRDRLKAGTTEQHPARLVWRFHAVLFGRIPSLLFKSTDTVLTGIAVFIALAAFINPWLAKQIGSWLQETNGWQGVSRWWGLLPIVALVAWELMKANFEKYEAVRLEHASMRSALSKEWGGVAKSVGDFITSSKLSSKAPINPADQLEIAQAELDRVKALFFSTPSAQVARDVQKAADDLLNAAAAVFSRPSPDYQKLFASVMETMEAVRAVASGKT